jgi:chemotaxis protein histidine kinase CheA
MPFDSGDYEANKEKEAARNKTYYEANKEKLSAQKKAYYEANKEKIAAKNKAYREANKEKLSAYDKARYEANKEKALARHKAYREANKEKERTRNKAYREANKEKELARHKAYREANKERIKAYYEANKEKIAAQNKVYYEANKERLKEKYMLRGARKRAKKNSIPFNLTEDYLKSIYPSDMICPVLGFEMSTGLDENGSNDTSPSLDRIIPEKGYVQGNVVVVSMRANTLKRDATPEELRKVADFYGKVFEQLDNKQLELDFMNEG